MLIKSKENKNKDASKVQKANLKAGMAAWLSQKSETYPLGIETSKRLKIESFKKRVIFSSTPFVKSAPSIKLSDGFLESKSAPEIVKPPKNKWPTNQAPITESATGLTQETPEFPKMFFAVYKKRKVVKKALKIGNSGGKKSPTKVPDKRAYAADKLTFFFLK